jgi:hypothetical protein
MTGQTPALDTLADLTATSVEHNSLALPEFMLARMTAPDPGGGPPASYLANAEAAAESGVTADDIQGHGRGCPDCRDSQGGFRTGEDPQGLGFAIAVADSEMAEDGDAGQ